MNARTSAAAAAGANGLRDHVGVVAAGEDRDVRRRLGSTNGAALIEKRRENVAADVARQRLDGGAQHRAGDATVAQRHGATVRSAAAASSR